MSDDAAPPPAAPAEELLAAYVGPRWDSYYRARFAARDAARGWRRLASWNWAAALVPFWLAYRRRVDLQMGWAVLFVLVELGVIRLFNQDMRQGLHDPLGPFLITYAFIGALQGFSGNGAVYREARLAIRHADAGGLGPAQATEVVRQRGGVSGTGPLVCLLLLVLALPFTMVTHSPSDLMYVAPMKSDLRNLGAAMETYYADSLTYPAALPPGYSASTGITVELVHSDRSGFSARSRSIHTPARCGIFYGTAPPLGEGAREGEPQCQSREETRRFLWLWRTHPPLP